MLIADSGVQVTACPNMMPRGHALMSLVSNETQLSSEGPSLRGYSATFSLHHRAEDMDCPVRWSIKHTPIGALLVGQM